MNMENHVRQWAEAYDRNGYLHGAVLVASKKHILLNEGFGLANREHGTANGCSTRFRIGSITKGMTAMAVFQLAERGLLRLDDSVGKYLPDYPNGDRITVYHCLTHTSGIPNYTSDPDFWIRTMRLPSTHREAIGSFRNRALSSEPGARFSYSNSGYLLLTAIIENVSGQSYADYMTKNIFLPLGMYDTGCADGTTIVPGLASGYSYWEKPVHAAHADLSAATGAYGIYSTTGDLLKWAEAATSSQLIGRASTDLMLKPNLAAYACGWMTSPVTGRACLHHFGDTSGYFCDLLRFDEDDVTVIVLSNMDIVPVVTLSRELAAVVFGEEVTLPEPLEPVPVSGMERFAGVYAFEAEPEKTLEIAVQDQELYVTATKRYGAAYKFKLMPIRHTAEEATLMTQMIHETLVFRFAPYGDQAVRILYTDYEGGRHMLHKR